MKREREKKITRLHLILLGLVITIGIIVFVVVKSNGSRKIEKYKKLEKDLNTATLYYYGEKANKLGKGQMDVVTMKTLIKNGYLQDEITSKCNGYTIIRSYRNLEGEYELGYYSYIKCGNSYETANYDSVYTE